MKNLLLILAISSPLGLAAQTLDISGTQFVEVDLPNTMGYTKAYVLRDAAAAKISYNAASSSASVQWSKFSSLGAAFSETVAATVEAPGITSLSSPAALGYVIEESGRAPLYFWIVDYAQLPFDIQAVAVDEAQSDCSRAYLAISGAAGQMQCYSINGRPYTIDRRITVSYNTLKYNQDDIEYRSLSESDNFEYADGHISIPAPLCDTRFTIHPDRFASAWGVGHEVESDTYTAIAVDAQTVAEQVIESYDNEQKIEAADGSLGGSAPCIVQFKAALTDAAIYHRWEMARSNDFIDVFYTNDETSFEYTFTEAGTTFVRLLADNAAATCPYEGEIYTINIGESRLECPNAFAPARDGGDQWKVSYKSIVDFHCEIFNRWGKRLAELTHPSQGWDGIVGGKPVPSGVYFYVISATGADGKEYKLSGDINVINSRRNTSTASPAEE